MYVAIFGLCRKMPSTAAERKRKQVTKMKENGTYEAYLKVQKQRMANERRKTQSNLQSLPKKNQNEAIIQQRCKEHNRKAAYRSKLKTYKANTPTIAMPSFFPKCIRTLIVGGGGYNKEGGLAIQLNFVVWGGHNKLKWGGKMREKYIKWGGRH